MASEHRSPCWSHARGSIDLGAPQVMGIVNLTPDSFFDGGYLMPEEGAPPNLSVAVQRAQTLVAEGAAILDLGGESTRPGARPVSPEEERRRVLPVLQRVVAVTRAPISVDTRRAAVAREALAAGASIINDVSGLADPAMAEVVARGGAGLVISHLRGEPATMQEAIAFASLVPEIIDELAARIEVAERAGIPRSRIVVDPGIGFGKDPEQSAALVVAGHDLEAALGCPVLIGASRKSFLGVLTGKPVEARRAISVAAALAAVAAGARIVRVHDVRETAEALGVVAALHAAYARQRQREVMTP